MLARCLAISQMMNRRADLRSGMPGSGTGSGRMAAEATGADRRQARDFLTGDSASEGSIGYHRVFCPDSGRNLAAIASKRRMGRWIRVDHPDRRLDRALSRRGIAGGGRRHRLVSRAGRGRMSAAGTRTCRCTEEERRDLRPDRGRARRPARGRSLPVGAAAAPDCVRLTSAPSSERRRLAAMCGIVGYIGSQNAAPILMEGLFRLEYRGYDSAGIAIVSPKGTQVYRRVGRVRELEASLPRRLAGKAGIGHTRWATHGAVTQENAHPQVSEDGRISCRAQRHHRQRHGPARGADRARARPSARRPTPRWSRT